MNFNKNSNYTYRPCQSAFNAAFIHENDVCTAEDMIRRQIPQPTGRQPMSRPRRGARKAYNDRRLENFRIARNFDTMNTVAQELNKKIYAGVKDGLTTLNDLKH